MKSKWIKKIMLLSFLALAALWGAQSLISIFWLGPFHSSLKIEWIDNQFPENTDQDDAPLGTGWNTLAFGYTLGPWPAFFRDNPIVMKMTYQKAPPQKFIQSMTQVWDPINVELAIDGPKTLTPNLSSEDLKSCLSGFAVVGSKCSYLKKKFYDIALKDLEKWSLAPRTWELTWFQSLDVQAAKGIHVKIDLDHFEINRYVIFTDQGITQNFTLKSIKDAGKENAVGDDAKLLFAKIIAAMKVRDDLVNSRSWIQSKIEHVQLNKIRSMVNVKLRLTQLILVQNTLFSQLSIDPTRIDPFFHLAGVTHLFGAELLKEKSKLYEHQDSWITHVEPLLKAILMYAKDFENSDAKNAAAQVKNIESLLQDILLLEQKISN